MQASRTIKDPTDSHISTNLVPTIRNRERRGCKDDLCQILLTSPEEATSAARPLVRLETEVVSI